MTTFEPEPPVKRDHTHVEPGDIEQELGAVVPQIIDAGKVVLDIDAAYARRMRAGIAVAALVLSLVFNIGERIGLY